MNENLDAEMPAAVTLPVAHNDRQLPRTDQDLAPDDHSTSVSNTDDAFVQSNSDCNAMPALCAHVVDEDAEIEREKRLVELELMFNAKRRKRWLFLAAVFIVATIVATSVALLVPKRAEETCGDGKRGDGKCPNGYCCSIHGYCGKTAEYCAREQIGFCGDGVRGSGTCAEDGHCCSAFGYCGTTEEHCKGTCGMGLRGDGVCPDGTCCSPFGFCGTTEDHCNGNVTDTGGRNLRHNLFNIAA